MFGGKDYDKLNVTENTQSKQNTMLEGKPHSQFSLFLNKFFTL